MRITGVLWSNFVLEIACSRPDERNGLEGAATACII